MLQRRGQPQRGGGAGQQQGGGGPAQRFPHAPESATLRASTAAGQAAGAAAA
jgi:hypothetical protein